MTADPTNPFSWDPDAPDVADSPASGYGAPGGYGAADGSVEGEAPETVAALHAFRTIGAPLLAAVTEVRPFLQGDSGEGDAETFRELLAANASMAQQIAGSLGVPYGHAADWQRWAMAGTACRITAAHYRATGKAITEAQAAEVVAALPILEEAAQGMGLALAAPGTPMGPEALRLKMMEAMAPVVGAIARYSFGRTEQALVGEVAARLQKTASEAARAIAGDRVAPEAWQHLYGGVLEVAGHLYAESHYAEADRLLDMRPDERTAYLTRYGNQVPMGPVWESFDLNMAMLTAVAAYMEVPAMPQLSPFAG